MSFPLVFNSEPIKSFFLIKSEEKFHFEQIQLKKMIKEIELKKKNSFHWEIVLNRAEKYNAINISMYEELIDIFQSADKDENLILLSIRGNGKYFSSGTDLTDPMTLLNKSGEMNFDHLLDSAHSLLKRFLTTIIDFRKILIAFVNGPAVGISVSILGLFDGVYASSRSTFVLPFTRTGQSPEGCSTFQFIQLMGSIQAKDLLLFNRQINAEQALQRGLITEILSESNFENEIERIAQEILSLPKESLLSSKHLIQKWNQQILHQVNEEELNLLRQRWKSEEFFQSILKFNHRKQSSKL